MGNIYFTSDLHFNHDRGFIYQPRGFSNVQDMNNAIITNWNDIAQDDDDIYVLGDICLGGPTSIDANKKLIESLKGRIHIIRGNHDTDTRIQMYRKCANVVEVVDACYLKCGKYNFYLSHYPTFTSNLEKEKLESCLINLYGHTHQKTNFYQDIPFIYHVGVDSHDCRLIDVDTVVEEIKIKAAECFAQV